MVFRVFTLFVMLLVAGIGSVYANESTNLYFGDTHLHTAYSFDAYLNQNQSADPDTAYRWAKGHPVIHPFNRARVQIGTPLDFLVVADHAEVLGVMGAVVNKTEELGKLSFVGNIKRIISKAWIRYAVKKGTGNKIYKSIIPENLPENPGGDPVLDPANVMPERTLGDMSKTEKNTWGKIIDAAERHYEPGKFTTLIGWEWSSIPTGANLHRVVFTPDNGEKAKKFYPFGAHKSQYPEDLWAWLDKTSTETGAQFIAIPHNSNISKGYMFAETTLRGQPITVDYARNRMVWEPVVEMTQIKGDSETHPSLSPDDPFADFEPYEFYIQQKEEAYKPGQGDFVRSGLRRGLAIEDKIGVNPYKFGVIGSTDSHTGLSSSEEDNFWGKFACDSTPETKHDANVSAGGLTGWDMSAAGVAAVWATENTREGIFSAFKRKEVYATTGPRIKVRFFGGWGFDADASKSENLPEIGYSQGVPMGSDLARPSSGQKIQFLVRAVKDPKGANLDRIQVVKGWLENGTTHEKVFNAVWSGDRLPDAGGKLPSVGNTVNQDIPSYTNTIGAPELSVVWKDPEFNPDHRAFYYIRVLQIPTPRHSLYDAVALQSDETEKWPAVIQERAYTSPIWYTP